LTELKNWLNLTYEYFKDKAPQEWKNDYVDALQAINNGIQNKKISPRDYLKLARVTGYSNIG
jgi:hypothetical protein